MVLINCLDGRSLMVKKIRVSMLKLMVVHSYGTNMSAPSLTCDRVTCRSFPLVEGDGSSFQLRLPQGNKRWASKHKPPVVKWKQKRNTELVVKTRTMIRYIYIYTYISLHYLILVGLWLPIIYNNGL